MRNFLLLTLCAVLCVCFAGSAVSAPMDRGSRKILLSGKKDRITRVEIVIPRKTPLLSFAAKELEYFLRESGNVASSIVTKPTPGAFALILGDHPLARAAGLDVKKLPSEGFYIKRKGKRIFLLGYDDPDANPWRNRWRMRMKRGTLSAVYDFLERFAGVRFYFPGEMGTLIPRKKALELPENIDIMDRPDLIIRENYSGHKSRWYEKNKYMGNLTGENLNFLRQRYSVSPIPFGHGLAYLDLIKRFGATHPEYFALMPDGQRYKEPGMTHPGHICYHSGITEEIYKDVKTFLTGGKSTERGIKNWSVNFGYRPYVSVMPQDWLYWCCCEKCTKIAPGARVYQKDPRAAQAISNFLWSHTGDVARRLKKEKINAVVTQMAYGTLDRIPECDLPDNVSVQVAVSGMGKPEYWAADLELLKNWSRKMKGKVSIWTYPGKHMGKAEMKGIPAMMHRQTGKYLQHVKEYIYGVFLESETDYEIFNYLNYYTFAKITWDLNTDLEKLLSEHYSLMFGKGNSWMQKFFDELEELWCRKITGNIVNTPLGPMPKLPGEFDLWNRIYSPAKMKTLERYIDRAKAAAAGNPEAVKRIEFMRREMLGPIKAAAARFARNREIIGNWEFHLPGNVGLRPNKGERCEVTTSVSARRKGDSFIFTFECEEPLMKHIAKSCKGKDHPNTFMDSCVELFLNPSGDRKNYYHFIVNTNGAISDSAWQRHGKGNSKWDSGAKATVVKKENAFTVTLTIPVKALGKIAPGGFPVNFARHRALNGVKVKEIYYQWSPVPGRSFHATERWGVMKLVPAKSADLLKDGDFEAMKTRFPYYAGAWALWGSEGYKVKRAELDPKVFMTGKTSLHLINKHNERISAGQRFKGIKPNTKYRLSYFLKTAGLTGRTGAGAYLSMGKKQMAFPTNRITGDTNWHKQTFEFTAPSYVTPETVCIVSLWIWHAEGEAWFDNVSLCEIK